MSKFLLSSVLLLASHLGLSHAQGNAKFQGQGNVLVYSGTDINQPKDYIGCMAADGSFTADDCGVFTVVGNSLVSTQGNCTFADSSTPVNVDSIYGKENHAWGCAPDLAAYLYYSFQLANSTQLPVICYGNLDCYVDVKDLPEGDDKLPLWPFTWGSDQFDVPEGHTRGMFLWAPL